MFLKSAVDICPLESGKVVIVVTFRPRLRGQARSRLRRLPAAVILNIEVHTVIMEVGDCEPWVKHIKFIKVRGKPKARERKRGKRKITVIYISRGLKFTSQHRFKGTERGDCLPLTTL